MYRTSVLLLLLFAALLNGAFRVERFSTGASFPQMGTRYLESETGKYLRELPAPSNGPQLRRRFSSKEYRLYQGNFTSFATSPEGNFQRFIRPASMPRNEFYQLKYYDRIRMNGQGDISDCYFNGDTLFVIGLIRVLYLSENEWQYLDAYLPGNKTRGTGDCAVQSNPTGARIYLNGEDRGVETPNYLTDLTTGRHRIRLEHPDFAPVETTVTITANDISQIMVRLTSRYGGVTFTGFPRGASVKLDGRVVGKLPCSIKGLRPGSYLFTVDDSFHKRKEVPVEISSGGMSNVSVILPKAYGVITLPDVPVNSPWQINGETVASGSLRFNPGTHRVFWDGGNEYAPIDTVITLKLGDTVILNTRFAKRTGGIKVLPIPMACSLFVDGEYRGQAPNVTDGLSIGEHTIELKREGYKTYHQVVSVTGDMVQSIQCRLTTGKDAHVQIAKVSSDKKKKTASVKKEEIQKNGQVSFVSFPPCAEVYNGDSLVAITGKGTVSIPVGRYSFRFVNGVQTKVKTVTVAAGDKKAVLVTFGEM